MDNTRERIRNITKKFFEDTYKERYYDFKELNSLFIENQEEFSNVILNTKESTNWWKTRPRWVASSWVSNNELEPVPILTKENLELGIKFVNILSDDPAGLFPLLEKIKDTEVKLVMLRYLISYCRHSYNFALKKYRSQDETDLFLYDRTDLSNDISCYKKMIEMKNKSEELGDYRTKFILDTIKRKFEETNKDHVFVSSIDDILGDGKFRNILYMV